MPYIFKCNFWDVIGGGKLWQESGGGIRKAYGVWFMTTGNISKALFCALLREVFPSCAVSV